MRFLIHGNSPNVKTGYGIQIAQLARKLQEDGHEVACSSTYGIQSGVTDLNGLRVYGCGFDVNSNDLLHMHAEHWFDGQPGWIITCVDVWAMKNPRLADYDVAAWVPVDHAPLQPNVREFFQLTGAVPVAMSQFGARALADLDPLYVPLSVDTKMYRPVADLGGVTPREMCAIPEDAFLVGMVGMNKGWAKDRKSFNEAFHAFAAFEQEHPDAYLYVHTEKWGGAEGQNLVDLQIRAGIPEHKLRWSGGPGQYGYRLGYTPEMMATMYTAFDVLLAPSRGEGFCVPLIEAQACGTPVIVTDFSAQPELVGAGWKVGGQIDNDPAHHASYVAPRIANQIPDQWFVKLTEYLSTIEDAGIGFAIEAIEQARNEMGLGILDALDLAYDADRATLKEQAVEFAAQYDVDRVYDEYWRPVIAQLTAQPEPPDLLREPMPDYEDAVAVLCPVLNRPENVMPLAESFARTQREIIYPDDDGSGSRNPDAFLYFIADEGDEAEWAAIKEARHRYDCVDAIKADRGPSFAQKLNAGFAHTDDPWVLCIGDDVRFHEGWLDQARKLSGEYDVIGTNDTAGPVKNPKVANGSHADHFFVRRAYVDEYGASLDGPGVLAPECYRHWYTDMEIIKLARARGVFAPCLDSVVEHLHPGYDGNEAARRADPTYMAAVEHMEADAATWQERLPLIELQRTNRGKL